MNNASSVLGNLQQALRRLPGIGFKTAQRLSLHLLTQDKSGAQLLAQTLIDALDKMRHCDSCNNLSEDLLCHICRDPKRDRRLLCVVESPADVLAIEQTGYYRGIYFVLLGRLSPLEGIGPADLKLEQLTVLLKQSDYQEIILATNATVEGEATAHYILGLIKPLGIPVFQIAAGVPVGGELDCLDSGTVMRAFSGRARLL